MKLDFPERMKIVIGGEEQEYVREDIAALDRNFYVLPMAVLSTIFGLLVGWAATYLTIQR